MLKFLSKFPCEKNVVGSFKTNLLSKLLSFGSVFSKSGHSLYDRKGKSGRNRIAIIWPEPDRHPTNMAGFLTRFDICSSVVLRNTIIGNFHSTIL